MSGSASKIKTILSEIPLKVISGGVLFSWAIQIISHIKLADKELLEVLPEEYDRLILTGLIGAVVFSFLYFLIQISSNEKFKPGLVDLLGNFNFYILYVFLRGGNLALFFGILGLIASLFLVQTFRGNDHPSIKKFDLKNIILAALIIGYFSAFELLYEGQTNFFEITASIGSLSFLCIPVLFLRKRKRLYLYFIITLLLVHAIPSVYHLYMFGSRMPTSVYYAILESPKAESLEYISSKFNFNILLLILLFLFTPLALTFLIKRNDPDGKPSPLQTGRLALTTLLLLYSFSNGNIQNNILFGYYQNFKDYQQKNELFKSELEKRNNRTISFEGLKDLDPDQKCTFVLVIGESTGLNHMSLYDYYRPTNPKLESIRNELFVFNKVISPHSHTQAVLEKVLTFANFENMKPLFEEGTIIELFKQAGFKTFWLSNQFFLNEKDHITGSIAKTCDWTLFVNNEDLIEERRSYDERLLSPLEKILEDSTRKKFIVVHMLGTHDKYSKRYPPSFNTFTKKDEADIPTGHREFLKNNSWAREKINEYDNAVLYNDHVLYEIINRVKTKEESSYVLYFSDHGEDVYDSRPYFSHQEIDATPLMFEVPFLVWFSDTYKKQWHSKTDSIKNYVSRKYQTDDVIHSLIDISNLALKRFSSSKSIFSSGFKEEKRYMNGLDYDSIAPLFEIYRAPLRK